MCVTFAKNCWFRNMWKICRSFVIIIFILKDVEIYKYQNCLCSVIIFSVVRVPFRLCSNFFILKH